MPTETLSYTYTTQAEIERLFSAVGALRRADDDADGVAETSVWNDVIYEATDEVNLYLERWYEPEDMANNLWIRRQASWIGAHHLSQRRGNPAIFQDAYDRATNLLEKVFMGQMQVPRLPQRSDLTPSMSNLAVDLSYVRKRIRVQQTISTGGTSSRQDQEYWIPPEARI